MSDSNDGPSHHGVIAAFIFFVLLCGVDGLVMIGNTIVDRKVVESSRQYAESNTAAFYSRLESVNKISVQLASTTLTPEMRVALTSQRDLLESEMRREVDKIPVGSRTSAMIPYATNN